jgi:hypothetical protein
VLLCLFFLLFLLLLAAPRRSLTPARVLPQNAERGKTLWQESGLTLAALLGEVEAKKAVAAYALAEHIPA